MSEQIEQQNNGPTSVPEKKDNILDTKTIEDIGEETKTSPSKSDTSPTETIKSPENNQNMDEQLEDLKEESNSSVLNEKPTGIVKNTWGGKREGAGREFGSKNRATKERKIVEEEFKQRILKNAHGLFNSQLNIASGCSFLFRVDVTGEGSRRKEKHVLVTDPEEIRVFLDGDTTEEYYYITTKSPDNKAIDSLIDRVFGRATQGIEVDANVNVSKFDTLDDKQLDEQIEQLEDDEGDAPNAEGGETSEVGK